MQEKEIKGIQVGKEELKLSLFTNDIILYAKKNSRLHTQILELINEFGKDAGYKTNIQKSTNDEESENELKKISPLTK